MARLTRELAEFVSACRDTSLPEGAKTTASVGFTDCFGVMMAGSGEQTPIILSSNIWPTSNESTLVVGTGRRADAPTAALINGAAAHALDFDDVANQGHASAVLVPAILAEAEGLGVSGDAALAAYVAGYEVWAELVLREPDQHHRKGWHPTGIFGTVGAAAACAYLRKLTPEQTQHALALAASQSSGLVVNFGSMAKPFLAGRAAQNGLMSARLAEAGMSGAPDALENRRGLLMAASPRGRVDLTSPISAGRDWHILRHGLTLKKYPTCLSTHRCIEATLRLREEYGLSTRNVLTVTVSMSRRNAEILHSHRPTSAMEAKFSAAFAVAAALHSGQVSLEEMTDEYVLQPEIQGFLPKVSVEIDDREDPATGYAPWDSVVITTADHSTKSCRLEHTPGNPQHPLSKNDLLNKFCLCLTVSRKKVDQQSLFDNLMNISRLENLDNIYRAMTGQREVEVA